MEYGRGHARALVTVLLGITICLPLGGMLGFAREVRAQPEESVLRIGLLEEVDSLNPFVGYTQSASILFGLVYDCLQGVGNDLEPVPNLAKSSWAVPETDPEMLANGYPWGSVWQYNLTPNATFTDGEPFTAQDVEFSIELNAQNYDWMWAYQPYSYFMKDARVVDDHTVRIYFWDRETGDPIPAAFGNIISIHILPKHKLETLSPSEIGFSWTGVFLEEDIPIVGTGPFMATNAIYSEWLSGDHITLVRNPNYHWLCDYGKEIHLDKILLKFYSSTSDIDLAIRSGQIDVASLTPQLHRQLVYDVQSGNLQNVTTFSGLAVDGSWTEVGVNMRPSGPNPSRLDPSVRQAMAMATNKRSIVETFYLGHASEGSTLISPVNPYWHYEPDETEKFQYDIVAANSLLEAAGYRDTNGDGIREAKSDSLAVQNGWVIVDMPLQYEMLIRREYPEERDIAFYLEGEWEDIGIDLTVKIVDESDLSTIVYSYAYDTMIWYWSADIDPNYQLFVLSQAAWYGWSDCMYLSQDYETNYTMSVTAMDRVQRKQYVDNCQRVFYRDAPYIILAYVNQSYAWRTDTFSGWGDWETHLGRSIGAHWSGNPLYFDLAPIDFIPPITSIDLSGTFGNNGWYVSNVYVNLTAVDNDSAVANTVFRVDSNPWQNYTGTFILSISSASNRTIQYYSVDSEGNVESVKITYLRIDSNEPSIAIVVNGTEGANSWYVSSVRVDFEVDDLESGAGEVFFRAHGGEWTVLSYPLYVDGNGDHEIEAYCLDAAGNAAPTISSQIKIDAELPSVLYDGAVQFASNDVVLEMSCRDNFSGLDTAEASLDGSSFVAIEKSTPSPPNESILHVQYSDLENGLHILVIRVYDHAGNIAEKTILFNVDAGTDKVSPAVYFGAGIAVAAVAAAAILVGLLLMRRLKSPGVPKE